MLINRSTAFVAVLAVATAPALALDRFYVTDPDGDKIWSVADVNGDGDFNDPGDVVAFYDDTIGGIALTTNNSLKRGPGGSLFVADTGTDQITRFVDLNSDGDANDAGEATVWFDAATNGSGIAMPSALNLWVDASGVVWVANSGNSGAPADTIVRMEDLNADGDANDAGEARNFYTAPATTSVPTAVAKGPDGAIYYIETSTAAPKSVWRLVDLDASGVIDQPGEAAIFFTPPAQAASAFHWALRFDAAGNFYMQDTGNELLWKFADANANQVIDAGEATIWWSAGATSNVWDFTIAPDGSAYLCESQTPDRLLHLVDLDANGTIGAGETTVVYLDTAAAADIADPHGIELAGPDLDGAPFCAGDGIDPAVTTPCPCANVGGPGRGCANSVDATGALLDASGSNGLDTVVLAASGMPSTVSCIYLQGDALDDTVFGDGVRCAAGSLIRLRTKQNAGGASSFPDSTDTITLSQRGGVVPGSGAIRYYQTYYRNAAALFCPPETFNVTNGFRVTW